MSYVVRERRGDGWLFLASVILVTSGVMRLVEAWWAFTRTDETGHDLRAPWFGDDLTAYGWLWLVTGVLLIGAGFGVISGSERGRSLGIAVAALGGAGGVPWLYDLPVWSLVSILLAALAIHTLLTHRDRDDHPHRREGGRTSRTGGRPRSRTAMTYGPRPLP